MKNESLISSILAIFILFPSPAKAAIFSKIQGFGDSLSDTGNVNELVLKSTGRTITFPPSPPYDQGRFSNGKIWLELLAEKLDVPLVNSAFGGATTGNQNTLDTTLSQIPLLEPLLGLEQQINNFVNNNPMADPEALYTIWVGANDYLPTNSTGFSPYDTPQIPLMNIEMAINSLVDVGAKQIMVLNLPNLGELPKTNDSLDGFCPLGDQFDADCLNDLTMAHNNSLSSLFASLPSDVHLIPVDANSLVSNIIDDPAGFELTNVTDGCLDLTTFTLCSNPDEHLFWDDQHPSRQGHRLVANLAFDALGIPEPRAIAGLITVALMAMGTVWRKNH